jgi:hypothetical protein
MTETARALLTAAVLAASALTVFAWRVTRLAPDDPHRLIGQLRLAQWAALALAATGGASIGLAVAHAAVPLAVLDLTLGVAFVVVGGLVLIREPQPALLLVAAAFVVHALTDIAHRPGWLAVEVAPRWYVVGCAAWDAYVAALCYWARRR